MRFIISGFYSPRQPTLQRVGGGSGLQGSIQVLYQLYSENGYRYNGTEWATKLATHFEEPGVEYSVDLTLCVASSINSQAQIEFKVSRNISELQPEPRRGARMGQTVYDTAAVRKQLRISYRNARDRGIFPLTRYELENNAEFSNLSNLFDASVGNEPSESVSITAAHPIYESILSQTLAENNSVVSALQGILSLFQANDYYDHLQFVNVTSTAKIQTVQFVVVPTGKRGFYIVCGIIVLHFLSVVVVFWLFFSSPTPKFLDQASQTVSQLHKGNASTILENASNIGDREIAQLPSAAGRWDKLVEISVDEKTAINCQDSTSLA
jgi:hypothetical protein